MLKIRQVACLFALMSAVGVTGVDAQEPESQPAIHQRVPEKVHPARSPAARYSPLAANGGYQGQRTTWYEAALHSLNPRNIDWGSRWEQRRAIFLENTIGNRYFVFCAFLVLCFYAFLVALDWIVRDHKKDIRYFETELAKGRSWARYWKIRATEAIRRYNDHIEKCNRVIEAGESGVPIGASGEASAFQEKIDKLQTEVTNLGTEKLRLKADLDTKKQATAALAARVEELEKTIGTGLNGGHPVEQTDRTGAMARRINRLEELLAAANEENNRLKGA